MNLSIWFNTMKPGWFIMHIKGLQVKIFKLWCSFNFFSPWRLYWNIKHIYPSKQCRPWWNAAFHLRLLCLPKYSFKGNPYTKDWTLIRLGMFPFQSYLQPELCMELNAFNKIKRSFQESFLWGLAKNSQGIRTIAIVEGWITSDIEQKHCSHIKKMWEAVVFPVHFIYKYGGYLWK